MRAALARRVALAAAPASVLAAVRVAVLAAILVGWILATAPAARAQVFFASSASSGYRVGPLTVRATVGPDADVARVEIRFSLAATGRAAAPQDFYLLWPGEIVRGPEALGSPDPTLKQYVEGLGFDELGQGRVELVAEALSVGQDEALTLVVAGGAPFVVFVQSGGPLGLSPPATWVRVPWTSRFSDRRWLMRLSFDAKGLIKPRRASWWEDTLLGRRNQLALSFNEVRDRPLFAMYFQNRDRVVRLADAPAELVAHFTHSEQLKIDQVYPPTSIRRVSESLESTEVVSLFLDSTEGIVPQQLNVQFGYFARIQSVAVVVVPLLLLGLGYAVGPVLGRLASALASHLLSRLRFVIWGQARDRVLGVVLGPEQLGTIVPGKTTFAEVVALCGREHELQERLGGARTLIYRGRLVRPETRRVFAWLAAVQHLEVEHHEVTIDFEGDLVRDVRSMVRRTRMAAGERLTGDHL
jgi:hypothetical protein